MWASHTFAGLRTLPLQVAGEPSLKIAAGWFWILLVAVFGVSLASQLGLYLVGLYSVSADDSARALLGHDLTLAKALEPVGSWPPLPKILTGLALKVYDDLVIAPRILSNATGLLTLGALVLLSHLLFGDRMITLVTGMLGVLLPQRLILSVAPLPDIYVYLFTLLAAAFLIGWLRRGGAAALTAASICLLLAATVRYEAWFFNVVLAFYLLYRALIRRDLGFGMFVLNAALLAAFPCAWIVNTYLHYGSLSVLGLTSQQFVMNRGLDIVYAVRNHVITIFLQDVAFGPAFLIGSLGLLYFVVWDRAIRAWALLLFIPLAVFGAIMAATLSISLTASYRLDGMWVLLLVPFAAWAIVWLAQRIARAPVGQYLAVAIMAYVCVAPFALRSQAIAQHAFTENPWLMSRGERALGMRLRTLLRADDRNILLDAIDNLDFLHVIVFANAPERFILNVDADPDHVAVYASRRDYYVKINDTEIVEAYLTDKFAVESGLDVAALRARNIGYVLVRNPAYVEALDANPQVTRQESFDPWVLFALRDS